MENAVGPTPRDGGRNVVILVVDDEPAIRRFVIRALEKDGIGVVEAPDGRAALDVFAGDPDRFAAVFCDLSLPEVAGEDVVRAVRAARPSMPVVVMTGHDPLAAEERIGLVGPLEWLQKPFSLASIGEMARKIVATD